MENNSSDDLLEQVNHLDKDQLLTVIRRVLRFNLGPATRRELAIAIMGTHQHEMVNVGHDRAIAIREIRALQDSPIVHEIEYIIRAALEPDGPFQTRELMLKVIQLMSPQVPFFLVKGGISKKHKTQVGYILSMAGFERRSAYDKYAKKPVKAWKTVNGTNHMTIADRTLQVEGFLSLKARPTPAAPEHLEDLI